MPVSNIRRPDALKHPLNIAYGRLHATQYEPCRGGGLPHPGDGYFRGKKPA
jgi:hypothetical protein